MKKRLIKVLLFAACGMAVCSSVVYAASSGYRFTHNDHDTLMIGEITSVVGEKIEIKAADYIVNTGCLNENSKEQLRPETATVTSDGGIKLSEFEVGDLVIASLDKNGDEVKVAWGIYRVDSTDFKTLKVFCYSPADSAMYTDFVNSGGVYCEFLAKGSTVIRVADGVETIIYQEEPPVSAPTQQQEPTAPVESNEPVQEDSMQPVMQTNTIFKYAIFVCGITVVVFLIVYLKRSR